MWCCAAPLIITGRLVGVFVKRFSRTRDVTNCLAPHIVADIFINIQGKRCCAVLQMLLNLVGSRINRVSFCSPRTSKVHSFPGQCRKYQPVSKAPPDSTRGTRVKQPAGQARYSTGLYCAAGRLMNNHAGKDWMMTSIPMSDITYIHVVFPPCTHLKCEIAMHTMNQESWRGSQS